MQKLCLSLTVADAGRLVSYDTLVSEWSEVQALARDGVDAVGRKVETMQITVPENGTTRTYTPAQIVEFAGKNGRF